MTADSGKTIRSVRASKSKLTKALYAAGMKSQTQLAEKIADNEGINSVPKNLVSRVFTGKQVDPLSLERVTTALKVETHTVLLTASETDSSGNDRAIPSGVSEEDQSALPTPGTRGRFFLLGVVATSFLCGVATTAAFYWQRGVMPINDDYSLIDFSFVEGKPPSGYGIFHGMLVGIDTLNMESVGYSIRDQLNTSSAKVSMSFREPIEYFRLEVSYVLPPDEFLTSFSIGMPSEATGDLIIKGDIVTSNVPGDDGAGSLIWRGLNTRVVNFEIGNLPESTVGPALVIDAFGFRPVQAQ